MQRHELHEQLIDANALLHVSCTGAGPQMLSELWAVPGASQYLVGCALPYAASQLSDFLGFDPEGSSCSKDVALDMAMASYVRASEHAVLTGSRYAPVGLAVTASVATTRMPRGLQRAHICVITKDAIRHVALPLEKRTGEAARRHHDTEVSLAALDLLQATLTGRPLGVDCTREATERFFARPVFRGDGRREMARCEAGVFLAATLNPLHDGHRAMCEAYTTGPVTYLVEAAPPHKPALSVQELLQRAARVRVDRWHGVARTVEFSRGAPLFLDKARRRPGSTFLIGADSMKRLLDPDWGVDTAEMLAEMAALDTNFLVMGREIDGQWVSCRDIPVPFPHQLLFAPLEGRVDLSSTELRSRLRP